MHFKLNTVITVIISATLSIVIYVAIQKDKTATLSEEISNTKVPLYWVAPMDDNYRRDQPGKSPMGMDLVPVYKTDKVSGANQLGIVQISPNVMNNFAVTTAKAETKSITHEISTLGYVKFDQNKLVHIHPRVDGWVDTLFVKATGDTVKQGQPLYTLYSPQLVNAQEEFLIALKRSNNSLIVAARERLKALQLSNEFVNQLEKFQKVKQNITFYAPQAGVVVDLKIREGFYVKPGNTLLSIGQLDQVWVEAEIAERDSALISQGLPVSITLDYLPGKQWKGFIDYIYPTLNEKNRTLKVRIELDNPKLTLKPNMFTQVNISTIKSTPILVVPNNAIIRTGNKNRVVIALSQGQFKSVNVNIGQANQKYTEILHGLKNNDIVVTSAHFLIDSESSKTSDFQRMSPQNENETPIATTSATVNGVINAIDRQTRYANISRAAIEKWNRPADTMDFLVASHVNLSDFKAGDNVIFTFEVKQNFVIVQMKINKHFLPNEQTALRKEND